MNKMGKGVLCSLMLLSLMPGIRAFSTVLPPQTKLDVDLKLNLNADDLETEGSESLSPLVLTDGPEKMLRSGYCQEEASQTLEKRALICRNFPLLGTRQNAAFIFLGETLQSVTFDVSSQTVQVLKEAIQNLAYTFDLPSPPPSDEIETLLAQLQSVIKSAKEKMKKSIRALKQKDAEIAKLTREKEEVLSYFESILQAHKGNYVAVTYDNESHMDTLDDEPIERDPKEMKFQISLKRRILNDVFAEGVKIYLAFTFKAFWQVFENENGTSRRFRELNYNPEIYFDIPKNALPDLLQNWSMEKLYLGFEHESNGREAGESRAWDRFYAKGFFDWGWIRSNIKLWFRNDLRVSGVDENPEIIDYYGFGEYAFELPIGQHELNLKLRSNFKTKSHTGSVEMNYLVPVSGNPNWYFLFHCFSGKGESLIDYDQTVKKCGIGIQFHKENNNRAFTGSF